LASVVWFSACTKSEVSTPSDQPSQPISPTKQIVSCPTMDDVRASAAALQKIIDEAESCLTDPIKSGASPERLKSQIKSCQQRNDDWKKEDRALIKNCELLLGADGTQVHREIPSALETLLGAGLCLDKSLDAAAASDTTIARVEMKRAHTAMSMANGVVDGKIKPLPQILYRTDRSHTDIRLPHR
jgi:hypothetical protein